MNKKERVLFIGDGKLSHYRVDLFNLLTEDFDLVVAHTGDSVTGANFNEVKISIENKGPFIKLKKLPPLRDYDVIIFPFNIRILNLLVETIFRKRNNKIFVFGIGVSASYNTKYDGRKSVDFLRKQILKKSDGGIFYELYPVVKYKSFGIDPSKLHVAYNTVLPPNNFNISQKSFESFMFIGTLYKQKKIYDLLDAYLKLFQNKGQETPRLDIVGYGDEYNSIKQWIKANALEHQVLLHGQLEKETELSPIYSRAIACISPGQAGLSVQKCFSYATPFITTRDAITGGESFSIIDGINGFYYDGSVDGLYQLMNNIACDKYDIKEISKRAALFYYNFRTPDIWKNSFIKAIKK